MEDRPDEILRNADEASRRVLENYWRSRDQLVQKIRPKLDEWYKAWRSFVEYEEDDIRSNLFVPLIFSHVEAYLPRLVANKPRIDVTRRGREDEVRAAMHRLLIHYDWDILKMAWVVINWVKAAEIYGTGIIKCVWRKNVQKRLVRESAPMLAQFLSPLTSPFAMGSPANLGPRFREVERPVTIWDDADAQLLELDEVFPDPDGWCEDSCQYITHRVPTNLYSVETAMRGGRPLYKNLDKLRKRIGDSNPKMTGQYETLREKRQRTFGPEATPERSRNKQEFHLLEEWQDGKVTTIVEEFPDLPPIRAELHELGMKPFIRFTPIPSPNDFYGVAIPEVLLSLNLEINTLHNARLDMALQSAYPLIKWLRSGGINPRKLRWRPGGDIPVDDMGDVDILQYPAPNFSLYRESESLRIWAQLASGATDPFQGLASSQTGGTATEAALLNQAASSRAGLMFQILDVQAMNRLGRLLMRLNEFNITDEKWISVLGKEFEGMNPIRIDPETLVSGSGLDLDCRISTAEAEPENRQFKLQRSINAIQVYGQIDPSRVAIDPVLQMLVEDMMYGFGIDNPTGAIEQLQNMVQGIASQQNMARPPQTGSLGQDLAMDQSSVAPDGRMVNV